MAVIYGYNNIRKGGKEDGRKAQAGKMPEIFFVPRVMIEQGHCTEQAQKQQAASIERGGESLGNEFSWGRQLLQL